MKSVGVRRARRGAELHPGLLERSVALAQVAGRAAVTTFSQIDSPPFDRGTMWSSVRRPFVVPQ
jgi:hypothetical protein